MPSCSKIQNVNLSNGATMKREMNQEQLREYNREAKKRERDRDRQEKEKLAIPNARDYRMPEAQQQALRKHAQDTAKTIATELALNKLSQQDGYIADGVVCVLFGLEKGFTQKVNEPFGVLVCGYFPDSAASTTIEYVHRCPNLLQSTTFAELYKTFLHAVVKWNNQTHGAYSTPEVITDCKAEIAGRYIPKIRNLPVVPAPGPVELPADAPSAPKLGTPLPTETFEHFVERTASNDIPPDALRYLSGARVPL
jgi:hypothetical protein